MLEMLEKFRNHQYCISINQYYSILQYYIGIIHPSLYIRDIVNICLY